MEKKIRLRTGNPTEVRRTLSRIANMVVNGEIEPKAANAIVLACNAILSCEKLKEIEARTKNIEARTEIIIGEDVEVEYLDDVDDEIYNKPISEEVLQGYTCSLSEREDKDNDKRTACAEDSIRGECGGEYGRLIRPEPGPDHPNS